MVIIKLDKSVITGLYCFYFVHVFQKRVCLGAGLQDDCPMETCDSLNLSNQPLLQLQPQLQPQPQLQLQPLVQPQLQPLVQSQLQFQPQFQLQPLVQPELQPLVQLQQNKQVSQRIGLKQDQKPVARNQFRSS